eukprot:TRINITY_DN696_c0_g1_i6.p1 TRINITY_DN696_c0_g1~~TRINITY_DN696_c0_g1_i6.p1  ORF type:complete len:213 (-),score=-9.56 TRINITY_DN696_c0_g1_i6:1074-1640(-)
MLKKYLGIAKLLRKYDKLEVLLMWGFFNILCGLGVNIQRWLKKYYRRLFSYKMLFIKLRLLEQPTFYIILFQSTMKSLYEDRSRSILIFVIIQLCIICNIVKIYIKILFIWILIINSQSKNRKICQFFAILIVIKLNINQLFAIQFLQIYIQFVYFWITVDYSPRQYFFNICMVYIFSLVIFSVCLGM